MVRHLYDLITNSLPLMGIGNPNQLRMTFAQSNSSLPLMGIGNWWRKWRRTVYLRSHYPSWGSETHVLGFTDYWVNGTHYPSWGSETRWPVCRINCTGSSLPLMGIGNQAGYRVRKSPIRCSLPLMGIGNRTAARFWRHRRSLITPHGDRKPEAFPTVVIGPNQAHYPSWGSETRLQTTLSPP